MRVITSAECLEWLESHEIDRADERGFPEIVGEYEVFFAAPEKARVQRILARELVEWVGAFERALLWVADWTAYEPEEMAVALALRRAHAESRHLIDAQGHVFGCQEKEELI